MRRDTGTESDVYECLVKAFAKPNTARHNKDNLALELGQMKLMVTVCHTFLDPKFDFAL